MVEVGEHTFFTSNCDLIYCSSLVFWETPAQREVWQANEYTAVQVFCFPFVGLQSEVCAARAAF